MRCMAVQLAKACGAASAEGATNASGARARTAALAMTVFMVPRSLWASPMLADPRTLPGKQAVARIKGPDIDSY